MKVSDGVIGFIGFLGMSSILFASIFSSILPVMVKVFVFLGIPLLFYFIVSRGPRYDLTALTVIGGCPVLTAVLSPKFQPYAFDIIAWMILMGIALYIRRLQIINKHTN